MRLSLVGIIVGVLMAGTVRAQDVLVLRDGTRQQGAVSGCRDDACSIGGRKVPRSLIVWVGLARTGGTPPAPRDPTMDEVHLVEGRIVTGAFGGLSLGAVAIGDLSFDRDEVAWIRFAGPEPAPTPGPSPSGPIYRFSASPAASGLPGPSPPPTPPSMPPPPPPPAPSPGGTPRRERGALWTGTLTSRRIWKPPYSKETTSFASLRLREVQRGPLMMQLAGKWQEVGKGISLEDEGSTVTSRETSFDANPAYLTRCWGEGTTVRPAVGGIYLKSRDVDLTPLLGFDVPRAGGRYGLAIYHAENDDVPLTCLSKGRTYSSPGRVSVIEVSHMDPREPRTALEDPEARGLVQGRMQGSYAVSDGFSDLTVSWMLCREGDACPPPPPGPSASPTPSPDPCGSLGQARSLVDVLWEQRQAYAGELEAEWNALEQAHGEMLDNVEAYRAAIDACAIWDIVSETLESASGWAGEFTEFGTKVLSGDLSAFVGEEPWKSLSERAWDVFPRQSTWAGLMHDRITGCSAPISHDLRTAALRFVDSWERVRGLMPAVQQKLNRIRTQDQKYWDQWNTYYRDCLEYARCKGLPPSTCPPPPASPSGPMPR